MHYYGSIFFNSVVYFFSYLVHLSSEGTLVWSRRNFIEIGSAVCLLFNTNKVISF